MGFFFLTNISRAKICGCRFECLLLSSCPVFHDALALKHSDMSNLTVGVKANMEAFAGSSNICFNNVARSIYDKQRRMDSQDGRAPYAERKVSE